MEMSLKNPSTRRKVLLGTVGIAAVASMNQMAGCSTTPVQILPAVLDVIQKAVSGACQIVPVIATLVDVIASVFPGAAGVATISDALAQQIATYICGLFSSAGMKAGVHPGKMLHATMTPVNGVTPKATTVELHGYMVVNGVLTYV
jgi:hypothetical protein